MMMIKALILQIVITIVLMIYGVSQHDCQSIAKTLVEFLPELCEVRVSLTFILYKHVQFFSNPRKLYTLNYVKFVSLHFNFATRSYRVIFKESGKENFLYL